MMWKPKIEIGRQLVHVCQKMVIHCTHRMNCVQCEHNRWHTCAACMLGNQPQPKSKQAIKSTDPYPLACFLSRQAQLWLDLDPWGSYVRSTVHWQILTHIAIINQIMTNTVGLGPNRAFLKKRHVAEKTKKNLRPLVSRTWDWGTPALIKW